MENWMPINDRYSVSSMGRVWSAKIGVMKTPLMNSGYPHFNICNDGKSKRVLVHRLMGLLFIPNPENKPTINHKNGIRNDNRVENLEWATSKEQNIHSVVVLGRRGANNNHRRKTIIAYRETQPIVVEALGIREMGRILNIPYQAVQNGAKESHKTYFGWKFEKLEDPNWISEGGRPY